MEDQNGGQGFDEDLFGGCYFGASRRVEVALHAFGAGEAFEGIDDVGDLGGTDVELERLIGFKRYGIFVAGDFPFGAEFAAEDFGDGGFFGYCARGAGDGGLLFVANFHPACVLVGAFGDAGGVLCWSRCTGVDGTAAAHGLCTFFMKLLE